MAIASYSSFQMLRSQYTTNSLILTIISNYLFSSLLVHTLHQQLGWGLHKQNRGVEGRGGVYIHNHLVASQHNRSQRDIVRHSEPKRFDVDLFTVKSFVSFANGSTDIYALLVRLTIEEKKPAWANNASPLPNILSVPVLLSMSICSYAYSFHCFKLYSNLQISNKFVMVELYLWPGVLVDLLVTGDLSLLPKSTARSCQSTGRTSSTWFSSDHTFLSTIDDLLQKKQHVWVYSHSQ